MPQTELVTQRLRHHHSSNLIDRRFHRDVVASQFPGLLMSQVAPGALRP
jgi:hypothetical protein